MCGIAGILSLAEQRPPTEAVAEMVSALRHRGPDESGLYSDPAVCLGHARLGIIGLAGGTQPIGNDSEDMWIVYNGEVFNYLELKRELEQKGYLFATSTDTEVVLHLYQEYGVDCLPRMNGQFALAIWDRRRQELFLARDRVGIRPLYFTWTRESFCFASEIKALFHNQQVARNLSPKALQQIFTFWTTLGETTPFEGVSALRPGHYMLVGQGGAKAGRYWEQPYYEGQDLYKGSFEDALHELDFLIRDAIRLRLRADVPVGGYLSGGLDSSLVSTLANSMNPSSLNTYSISFMNALYDEAEFQNQMARTLKTRHSLLQIDDRQVRQHLPEVIWHCESPLLRSAPVPLYLLSRAVNADRLKVVLTGEGADEVFGGYNIFKEAKIRAFWAKNPESELRPKLLQRLYPYIFKNSSRTRRLLYKFYQVSKEDLQDPLFSHRIRWSTSGKNISFFSNELLEQSAHDMLHKELRADLPQGFTHRSVLSRAFYLESEIFLPNYLLSSQGDRMAMANSLEIRLPFLDHRVMDLAARLPEHWKIRGLCEKYAVKKLASKILPAEIHKRTKQPYRAPIKEIFAGGESDDYLEELLSENRIKEYGYFNATRVKGLLNKYRRNQALENESQNMALMGILTTQLLHYQFVDSFPYKDCSELHPDKYIWRES